MLFICCIANGILIFLSTIEATYLDPPIPSTLSSSVPSSRTTLNSTLLSTSNLESTGSKTQLLLILLLPVVFVVYMVVITLGGFALTPTQKIKNSKSSDEYSQLNKIFPIDTAVNEETVVKYIINEGTDYDSENNDDKVVAKDKRSVNSISRRNSKISNSDDIKSASSMSFETDSKNNVRDFEKQSCDDQNSREKRNIYYDYDSNVKSDKESIINNIITPIDILKDPRLFLKQPIFNIESIVDSPVFKMRSPFYTLKIDDSQVSNANENAIHINSYSPSRKDANIKILSKQDVLKIEHL